LTVAVLLSLGLLLLELLRWLVGDDLVVDAVRRLPRLYE
jgi:hypothetical protein